MKTPDLPSVSLGPAGLNRWRWLISRLVVIALVGAGLLLIGMSRAEPGGFAGMRGLAGDAAAPLLSAARAPLHLVRAIFDEVGSYMAVRRRNKVLEQRIAADADLHERAARQEHEIRRLKALLRVSEPETGTVAVARLIGASAGSYMSSALVPVGRSRGVRIGQPVRDPDGLIGRIVEAGRTSARIMLVSDINSRIPVAVVRTGQPAIVAGANEPLLHLRYIAQGYELRAGDVLVTTGHGGLFAPGIPVGVIHDPDLAEPTVRPSAHLANLDFVTIQKPYFPAAATVNPVPESVAIAGDTGDPAP